MWPAKPEKTVFLAFFNILVNMPPQRYCFFFFPRKSLRLTHSLESEKTVFFFSAKREKKKQPNFGRFWHFGVFFFFYPPGKVYKPLTHSIWKAVFFFFRPRKKKKTPFLLTHSNMGKIFQNTNFSRNKKKTVPLDTPFVFVHKILLNGIIYIYDKIGFYTIIIKLDVTGRN